MMKLNDKAYRKKSQCNSQVTIGIILFLAYYKAIILCCWEYTQLLLLIRNVPQ